MMDVATAAGVSQATVSLVLSGSKGARRKGWAIALCAAAQSPCQADNQP
jgi:DNA-binding LacI/PurR family transcriptional regulator